MYGSQPEQGAAGNPPSTAGMLQVLEVYPGSEGNWEESQKEEHLGSLAAKSPFLTQQIPAAHTSGEINQGNISLFSWFTPPRTHTCLLLQDIPLV